MYIWCYWCLYFLSFLWHRLHCVVSYRGPSWEGSDVLWLLSVFGMGGNCALSAGRLYNQLLFSGQSCYIHWKQPILLLQTRPRPHRPRLHQPRQKRSRLSFWITDRIWFPLLFFSLSFSAVSYFSHVFFYSGVSLDSYHKAELTQNKGQSLVKDLHWRICCSRSLLLIQLIQCHFKLYFCSEKYFYMTIWILTVFASVVFILNLSCLYSFIFISEHFRITGQTKLHQNWTKAVLFSNIIYCTTCMQFYFSVSFVINNVIHVKMAVKWWFFWFLNRSLQECLLYAVCRCQMARQVYCIIIKALIHSH